MLHYHHSSIHWNCWLLQPYNIFLGFHLSQSVFLHAKRMWPLYLWMWMWILVIWGTMREGWWKFKILSRSLSRLVSSRHVPYPYPYPISFSFSCKSNSRIANNGLFVCPSIPLSVCPSVCLSVFPSLFDLFQFQKVSGSSSLPSPFSKFSIFGKNNWPILPCSILYFCQYELKYHVFSLLFFYNYWGQILCSHCQ